MSLNTIVSPAPPLQLAVPLARLEQGSRAIITEVVGQPEQVHRLKELGLARGAKLEMVRAGTPCIVRVHGQTLCIRGNELMNVLVAPGDKM